MSIMQCGTATRVGPGSLAVDVPRSGEAVPNATVFIAVQALVAATDAIAVTATANGQIVGSFEFEAPALGYQALPEFMGFIPPAAVSNGVAQYMIEVTVAGAGTIDAGCCINASVVELDQGTH